MDKQITKIVELAQKGDEKSFKRLYDLYYDSSYRYALRLCAGNESDAKDVMQDAFMEVHRSISNLKHPEYFNAWFSKIIMSKCVSLFRRNKDIIMDDQALKSIPRQMEKNKDYLPKSSIDKKTEEEIIQHMIEELPIKLSAVLRAVYYQQMSMKETADYLDIPMGTVKSRLKEAKRILKQKVIIYERREGRKIDFNLDALYPLSFSALILQKIQTTFQKSSTMQNVQVFSVAAFTTTTISAGIVTYDHFKQEDNNPVLPQRMNQLVDTSITTAIQDTDLDKVKFKVTYQNKDIETPNNAYYKLLEWASCEEEMKRKTEAEINEITPVFNELMSSDSAYRDLIILQEWDKHFSQIR